MCLPWIIKSPTANGDINLQVWILFLERRDPLVNIYIRIVINFDLGGLRINGGKSKIDMRVQPNWDLFRPEGLTWSCLCPSLKVPYYTTYAVIFVASRATDSLCAAEVLGCLLRVSICGTCRE